MPPPAPAAIRSSVLTAAIAAALLAAPATARAAAPCAATPTPETAHRLYLPFASGNPCETRFASDLHAAQARYPHIVGTRLSHCRLCHEMEERFWMNPYGRDYLLSGRDFAAVEPLDSDGDGYSNLAEIEALTFPGFSGSRPYTAP